MSEKGAHGLYYTAIILNKTIQASAADINIKCERYFTSSNYKYDLRRYIFDHDRLPSSWSSERLFQDTPNSLQEHVKEQCLMYGPYTLFIAGDMN